jgi:ribulose bisphosphate carboxylase small subunit
VWPPIGKKKFETLSYLPDLSDVELAKEVEECKKEYPGAFIRIIGFDNTRQVQCISFIA